MKDGASTKVLYATFDVVPEPTGTSVRSESLIEALGSRLDFDALTAKTPDHGHIERFHGSRLLRVPVGSGDVRSRAQAFDRAVRRQLQSEEYEIVHFTDPFGGYALCELRPNHGYKLVYDVRGFPSVELRYTDPDVEGDRKFLTKLRRQEIFCLMNSDLVIASCRAALDHIVSLGVPAEKIQLVPPAVDLEELSVPEADDDETCRLLYLGSHASWQGLPSLLFALQKVIDRAKFRARIVGPTHGSWRQQLDGMVREFNLKKIVKIEHPVPHEDVPELLEWSHVGLAPLMKVDRNMNQGAAPLKIAEYLVAGRPVIASDIPICRETIEENVTGALYPATDEDALADVIARVCSDQELRKRMSAEARARGCARFDSRSYERRILKIYEQLGASVELEDQGALGAFESKKEPSSTEPTVTLPSGARPDEPPPPVSSEPPTQTAMPLPDDGSTPPREEATSSVKLGEMPWSESTGSIRAPDESERDDSQESPEQYPDEEMTPAPAHQHSEASEHEHDSVRPPGSGPDEEMTPAPGDEPLFADHLQAEAPSRPHDDEGGVMNLEAEGATEAPPDDERPGEEHEQNRVRSARTSSAPSPRAEPPPSWDHHHMEETRPYQALEEDPSPTAGEHDEGDEPVEIDPDEAILLEDAAGDRADSKGTSPKEPAPEEEGHLSRSIEEEPSEEKTPARKEEKPPGFAPVVRGVLVSDSVQPPEYGPKKARRGKRDGEEDTSPGFDG